MKVTVPRRFGRNKTTANEKKNNFFWLDGSLVNGEEISDVGFWSPLSNDLREFFETDFAVGILVQVENSFVNNL